MPKYYVKLMTWFEVNDEETDPTNGNDRNKIASMRACSLHFEEG